MNLLAQKLSIIESLIQLNDKKTLSKIEDFLSNSLVNSNSSPKNLTKKDLINRAKKSNKNIADGMVVSQKKLEKDSDSW